LLDARNISKIFFASQLVATLGLVAMTTAATATMPERPVVLVMCPVAPDHDDDLCQALAQALREQALAGVIVRQVGSETLPPLRPGDVAVSLMIEERDARGISGHLEWHAGPDGADATSPQVRLDVMDTTLSPAMYLNFTRSLVQVATELRDALQSLPRP